MKSDQLLTQAFLFEKRAQQSDQEMRQQIFTTAIPPFSVSFRDQAFAVFKGLDKSLQDSGASQGPVYQLMDMMSSGGLPDPQRLLSLTQGVRDAATGSSVAANAADLVTYARVIINKFFTKQPEQPPVQTMPEATITGNAPAPKAPASESSYQFITRIYKQIRMGQAISDEDTQKWPNFRTAIVRRLNGLKGMATRTPQQEQERAVLQAVVDKLG